MGLGVGSCRSLSLILIEAGEGVRLVGMYVCTVPRQYLEVLCWPGLGRPETGFAIRDSRFTTHDFMMAAGCWRGIVLDRIGLERNRLD